MISASRKLYEKKLSQVINLVIKIAVYSLLSFINSSAVRGSVMCTGTGFAVDCINILL